MLSPDHPLYFNKGSTSLVGHQQPIVVYDYYGSVHPEPELAVIISKRSLHTANMNQVQLPVSMSITGLGTLYNPVEKGA